MLRLDVVSEANELCRNRESARRLYSPNAFDNVADFGHRWVEATNCETDLADIQPRILSSDVLVVVAGHEIQHGSGCTACLSRIRHPAHKFPTWAVLCLPSL